VFHVFRPLFRPFSDPAVRTLILGLYLSLRDLEEMMAERGIRVDHSTISRAIDSAGDTVEFFFNQHRDLLSASSVRW
jgi:transposase-like protein